MIQAKIVADSLSPTGDRLTTLEVIMPRYILAEGKTHRMISGMLEQTTIETSIGLNDEYCLSKNSASSRAIPFNKMVQEVQENPFIPYAWQKDHKGMQGHEYHIDPAFIQANKGAWLRAKALAIKQAIRLNDYNVTKQLANRLLEPFMYHKVLISATEWKNFFNLRCPQYFIDKNDVTIYKSRKQVLIALLNNNAHKTLKTFNSFTDLDWLQHNKGQADIHMMFLAEAIYDAINESTPKKLKEGEWHIPYGDNILKSDNWIDFCNKVRPASIETDNYEDVEDLVHKISIARCARLSYQTLGDNPVIDYEKDLQLYEVLSKSGHWSPFEHVAKLMTEDEYLEWNKGKLEWSQDKLGYNTLDNTIGWCRNFRGFIQQRVLID